MYYITKKKERPFIKIKYKCEHKYEECERCFCLYNIVLIQRINFILHLNNIYIFYVYI